MPESPAQHEYEILEEIECGIVLVGSEVKSIRNGKISIEEAYARVANGELWLIDCDIAEYPQANLMNHMAKRTRKLLLRKREMEKVAESATQKGLTLVPLSVYFSRGFVKVRLAVAKGASSTTSANSSAEKKTPAKCETRPSAAVNCALAALYNRARFETRAAAFNPADRRAKPAGSSKHCPRSFTPKAP